MRQVKINIIDYGMGNLQSVCNAFERVGCKVFVSSNPATLSETDGIVLPGVGAFGEAMSNLHKRKLVEPLMEAVLDEGKPLLGICLGMQLLADKSDERGVHQGLSLIPGEVTAIPDSIGLHLPHIGWNDLSIRMRDPLFIDLSDKSSYYFVHSYRFECNAAYISSVTNYGVEIAASVQRDHIFGVQFHPERSQRKGLHLLRNFINFVEMTAGVKES